jgi:hypothetical protein
MPVLLLARGDARGRELLKRGIESRYGYRPPALETLEVTFKGRAPARIGPLRMQLPLSLTLRIKFPFFASGSVAFNLLGITFRRTSDSFDGSTLRHLNGSKIPTVSDENKALTSARKRLWAINALLLTPLTEQFVELHGVTDTSLEATHTGTGDSALLTFGTDNRVREVQTICYRTETGADAVFKITVVGDQKDVDDLILPGMLVVSWDDTPIGELEPVSAQTNPVLPDGWLLLK